MKTTRLIFFKHSLNVLNKLTDKKTVMYIDPTPDTYSQFFFIRVHKLTNLRYIADEDTYNQAVADLIEVLIKEAGYTSLKIASLMKEALKHHKEPMQLHQTVNNVDLSGYTKEKYYVLRYSPNRLIDTTLFLKNIKEFVYNFFPIIETDVKNQSNTSSTLANPKEDIANLIGSSIFSPSERTEEQTEDTLADDFTTLFGK